MKFLHRARENPEEENGMIAIETLISLFIFMAFMYSMYAVIVMFMANNMIEHALMETAQSMALQSYEISELNSGYYSLGDTITTAISNLQANDESEEEGFYDNSKWYEDKWKTTATAVKRFNAYLGGDESHANDLLKAVGLQNGADDLNLKAEISGKDLKVTADYDIYLIFRMQFGHYDFGKFHFKQTAVSKMWGGT